MKPIHEYTYKIMMGEAKILEKQIRIVFKPAPWFIPDKWWFKLIAKFFVTEEYTK